jgi:sulfhydrogenase subunit beta (sulfur reductase)
VEILAKNELRILEKVKFNKFFEALKIKGPVNAPVKQGTINAFKKVKDPDEINLDYTRTMIPPKKYFIQPEEVIFTFDREKERYYEPEYAEEDFVLLGVHACDINAMNLLARVFMEELSDKYYLQRREKSYIIGTSCTPDEYCFCKSTNTAFAHEGFELFLHDLGERYLVRVGTIKGYRFVVENDELFGEAEKNDVEIFKKIEQERLDNFTRELEMTGLQDMLDMSYDDEVWDEYGEECLGCGNCNMVCPRCRCYDVQDYVNLDLSTGQRVRKWYSCMLQDHGLVAGGHNFRPSTKERIRNRFNCKGSLREDMQNCVGCGRCTVYCPADIDYVEVMNKVRGVVNE